MAKTLDVYLHSDLVGHLVQDAGGRMVFDYVESWLNKPGATPLSQSLPLRTRRFNRNECRGYFAGILPEESKREIIARNLGISARNDYAMLERIGGNARVLSLSCPPANPCLNAITAIESSQPKNSRRFLKNSPSAPC